VDSRAEGERERERQHDHWQLEAPSVTDYVCAPKEDNPHRIALRSLVLYLKTFYPFSLDLGCVLMPLPDDERGPHHEIRLES